MVEHPFFVIGLHPYASRLARRFSNPALVFNSHRQFEKLREDGRYWKIQAATRSREIDLQGSINPNLADFSEGTSEQVLILPRFPTCDFESMFLAVLRPID